MDKRELGKRLIAEADNEEHATRQNAFDYARQLMDAERKANIEIATRWAEKARGDWKAFGNGSLARNGRIKLLDGEIVTAAQTAPVYRPEPVNANGMPLCHSTGRPGECVNSRVYNTAALDWPCHQCNSSSTVWFFR